ncbi:MAG: hypothetical protein J7L73_08875 [Anaerolineales bacterium]|nr:hypothetical protein [Anaerolineales bacterium]HEY62242.1 hypothetical protein [Anaerolineae bacterium]
MDELIRIQTRAIPKISTKNYEITPFVKSIRIQPPGFWGILIWNRPSAIAVETKQGDQRIISITDYTRLAQLIILGIGIVGSILLLVFNRKNN